MGYWATEITANWTINELKWKWKEASENKDTLKMSHYATEAHILRMRLKAAGYSDEEIMQSADFAIPKEIVREIAWSSTFSWIENDPTGFGFLVWSSDKMSYLPKKAGVKTLALNEVKNGFIKHSVWNEAYKTIGKKGLDKFLNAMSKGFVRKDGEAGIKRLSGKGKQINKQWYQYELKDVSKEFGDYRFYGNWDEKLGKVVFTLFGRH